VRGTSNELDELIEKAHAALSECNWMEVQVSSTNQIIAEWERKKADQVERRDRSRKEYEDIVNQIWRMGDGKTGRPD